MRCCIVWDVTNDYYIYQLASNCNMCRNVCMLYIQSCTQTFENQKAPNHSETQTAPKFGHKQHIHTSDSLRVWYTIYTEA